MAERLSSSRKIEWALYATTAMVVAMTAFCVFVLVAGTRASNERQAREARQLEESRCLNFVNHAAIEATLISVAHAAGLSNPPTPNLVASDAVRRSCEKAGIDLDEQLERHEGQQVH